jgi:hypothetical protein
MKKESTPRQLTKKVERAERERINNLRTDRKPQVIKADSLTTQTANPTPTRPNNERTTIQRWIDDLIEEKPDRDQVIKNFNKLFGE